MQFLGPAENGVYEYVAWLSVSSHLSGINTSGSVKSLELCVTIIIGPIYVPLGT